MTEWLFLTSVIAAGVFIALVLSAFVGERIQTYAANKILAQQRKAQEERLEKIQEYLNDAVQRTALMAATEGDEDNPPTLN